jgi:pimeloyl-ACP methyl ester carboxylesterase
LLLLLKSPTQNNFLSKGLPSVPAAIASEVSCFAIRLPCEGPHGTHRVAIHIFDPPTGSRVGKEEKGSNVTLCVHGLSRNASDFEPLARVFAERRGQRVLAVDLPGRGLSDWFEHSEDYNYPQYLSDLHTILTALGYVTPSSGSDSGSGWCGSKNNVDWVGTSLGGLLGMFYVGLHPEVVRRLLMNDIGPVVPLAGLQRLGTYVGEKMEFPTLEEVVQYFRTKFTPFGKLTDEEWRKIAVQSVIKSTLSPNSPWVLSYDPAIGKPFKDHTKFTTDMEMWPVWEKMEGSGVQILLLRGEDSDLLTLKTVQDMIQRRPGPGLVRFLQFKECGHVPPLLSSPQIGLVLDFFTTPNESLTPLDSLPV